MNDYDAESLWNAVMHMASANPTSVLSPDRWQALADHMEPWYVRFHAGKCTAPQYQHELRRAWAELYLGRTP